MKEKSSDLIEATRFHYYDFINRTSDFTIFTSGMRKKTVYLEKAFNASYNNTLEFARNKINITRVDFHQAVRMNGFLNYPLSCYNKLIVHMKVEFNKVYGRNKASMDQVNQLFHHYHM